MYMFVCVYIFVYVFICVSPYQSEVRQNFVAYTVDSEKLYNISSKSDAIWDFIIMKKEKNEKKCTYNLFISLILISIYTQTQNVSACAVYFSFSSPCLQKFVL